MGGTAFNMNIPTKMGFLKVDTDDIDLKIYTTDINYLEKNTKALNRVLSVFRFTLIIMCFYLKQIMYHIHTYFEKLPIDILFHISVFDKKGYRQHKRDC